MKMQYGALLSHAWNIIWRNKIIWVFGFLAALGSGGGGGGNFRLNMPSSGRVAGGGLPPDLERTLANIFSNPAIIITIVVVLILIGLIIGLVVELIAALGHGAMVDMVREADESKVTRFSTGWRTGLRRMFPVFLIRFLLGLPTAIIILAGIAPFFLSFIPLITGAGSRSAERLFAGGMLTTLLLCFLPALCIGVLLTIPLQVLETLSIRALVLEDLGIWGSIRRGWAIFTGNLGDVVVVWLIFLLIGILVFVVVGVPLAVAAFAIIFPLTFMAATSPVFILPILLVGILLWLVSAAIRSIVEAYASTTWTLAYRQFIARSAAAPAPVPMTA
jgi:hypothetical protein